MHMGLAAVVLVEVGVVMQYSVMNEFWYVSVKRESEGLKYVPVDSCSESV